MPHLEIQVYNFDSQYSYKFTTLLYHDTLLTLGYKHLSQFLLLKADMLITAD